MKLFLDDVRTPPWEGWTLVRWPEEVIELLKTGKVTEISLDHDLRDDECGTGYSVIVWIEEETVNNNEFIPPIIHIHSANPVGFKRMMSGINSINRIMAQR